MDYREMERKALAKAAAIENAFGELIEDIYVLGVADGIEEKNEAVGEAYTRGIDKGYEKARREFHTSGV